MGGSCDDVLSGEAEYAVHLGDAIPHMAAMPAGCVDFTVFSPPFPSLYSYTSEGADIGNSEDLRAEAKLHLSFFYRQLVRVLKPGRVAVVHVTQIPRMKRVGGQGLNDFRGLNIRLAERAGLVFEYDWLVRVNPQEQALRTKSRELQFAGLETDRARSRGALCDYLLKFTAPGENREPVRGEGQVSRNDWIKWAEGCWTDVLRQDTLNTAEGKDEEHVRHICLARDSLVLTASGHKPIQCVVPGDMVLTHKGRWRPVTVVKMTGVKPCVQVSAQGVPNLILTPDHKLWTRKVGGLSRHREAATNSPPQWVRADETVNDYVNLKLPPVAPCPRLTPQEWWLVGRWVADGHKGVRGDFHISVGRNKLEEFVRTAGDHAGARHELAAVQIRLKGLRQEVIAVLSQCGGGANAKRIPPGGLTLAAEDASHLLAGYLSGDGHKVPSRERWMATSVSRELLIGVGMLAQRVYGAIASIHAGRKPGQTVIAGRTVNTQQEWVLSFDMPNAKRGTPFVLDDGAWKKVRAVSEVGERETWCLRVEEDESFTAEGCVVKNCPLQLEVIRRCVLLYSNPGEVVFSPFAGIGSEGFVALGGRSPKTGLRVTDPRRFYGCELSPKYHAVALLNLARAVKSRRKEQRSMFDLEPEAAV